MLISMLVFVLFGFSARARSCKHTPNPETLEYGVTYLSIILTGSIGLFMQIYCEMIFFNC